jgi:hypothetical protein
MVAVSMASRPKSSQGVGGRSSPFLPAPRPQTAMGLSREPSSPRPKVRAAPITQLRLLLVAFCCGLPQRRRVPQGASAVGTGTKAHDATAEMQHRQTQRQTPFAPSVEAWGSSGAHESPLALKSSQSLSSNTNPLSYAERLTFFRREHQCCREPLQAPSTNHGREAAQFVGFIAMMRP